MSVSCTGLPVFWVRHCVLLSVPCVWHARKRIGCFLTFVPDEGSRIIHTWRGSIPFVPILTLRLLPGSWRLSGLVTRAVLMRGRVVPGEISGISRIWVWIWMWKRHGRIASVVKVRVLAGNGIFSRNRPLSPAVHVIQVPGFATRSW